MTLSSIITVNRTDNTNWITLPLIMLVFPLGSAHVSSVAPFLNEMSRDMGVSIGVMVQLGTAQFIGAFVSAILLAPFIAQLQLRACVKSGFK
jgi:predicted MFS family arabinose efflux permease